MKFCERPSKTRVQEYISKLSSVVTDSINWKLLKDQVVFDLDRKLLKFKDPHLEHEYLEVLCKSSSKILKFLSIFFLFLTILNTILYELKIPGYLNIGDFTYMLTISAFIFSLTSFFTSEPKLFIKYEVTYLLFLQIFSLLDTFLNPFPFTLARYPLLSVLFTLIICTKYQISLLKSLSLYTSSLIAVVYESSLSSPSSLPLKITDWVLILLFIHLLFLTSCYSQDLSRRKEFIYIKTAELEIEKSSNILSFLLPDFVRKRVKDGARYIAEDKGTVSVIFCDICDFENLLNLYSPSEFTSLLNDLFGLIDSLCESFGVAKIETVGKTYLACAGLKDSEIGVDEGILRSTHARRAVELALAVIQESKKITLKDGSKVKFKIGVNSGPVTAGVVGYHKPQFSLVGDTVNTASRMASTLNEMNAVQISMSTFQMLGSSDGLQFLEYLREVKGKGSMMTKVVKIVENSGKDLNFEEVSSQKRGSLFSLGSPTLPSLKEERRIKRSSLLVNLDVSNTKELFNKQTSSRVNEIFSMICKESEAEKKFRTDYIEEISETQKIGLLLSLTCDSMMIIVETFYVIFKQQGESLPRLLIVVVGEVLMIFALVFRRKYSKSIHFSLGLSFLYSLEFLGFFVEFWWNRFGQVTFLYFCYKFILLNFFSGTLFSKNLLFNILTISLWLTQTIHESASLAYLSYVVTFIIMTLFSVFTHEKRLRKNSILKKVSQKELQKTQQLLTQMMPARALSTLEDGRQVMDNLKNVTLMFADVVGFTAWSAVRSPKEVVGMLSSLFTSFDKMCIENNVYKVHTIGDCYVVMGVNGDKHRNPAKEALNMIRFATCLIEVIQETNLENGLELGMRIGLHTGDFIGGITGTKIVRYDIYGTHVSIANKMESNGESGKIAVSETTKELIENYSPDSFNFIYSKDVYIPSLSSDIKLYFLDNPKSLKKEP
jgi:class 3 adenylate cyclase